jgi:hypothetical protein
MKSLAGFTVTVVLALSAACPPAFAQRTPEARPVPTKVAGANELMGLASCFWSLIPAQDRAGLVRASYPTDDKAWDAILDRLDKVSDAMMISCAPSVVYDPEAGGETLVIGLHREAMAEVINQNLKISRARLDAAINVAPADLTAALKTIADRIHAHQPPGEAPSLSPIFAALGQPTFDGPAPTPGAAMISVYALSTFQVRSAAEAFTPRAPGSR